MKAKEFIPASKTRNFVAKNAQSSGAGRHQDSSKKKDQEQGKVKHKKDLIPMEDQDMTEAVVASGPSRPLDDRAVRKMVWDTMKINADTGEQALQRALAVLAKKPQSRMVQDLQDKFHSLADRLAKSMAEGWSDAIVARRTGTPRTPYSVYIKGKKWKDFENDDHARAVMDKLKSKFKADGRDPETITIAPTDIPEGVAERVRDSEDWDEGNTEPPNNFAIYINGKKWKVIKGRGQYADDYKERDHLRQLNSMAQQKSQATGKKWTIAVTGEKATESIEEASALEKFRKAAAEREKKHNDAEKEMKARHASGKEDMKGSIDRLEKHLNNK